MAIYRVHLRDTATGQQAWVSEPAHDPDGDEWMWNDGNYACDCNRGRMLADALDLPVTDVLRHLPCEGQRVDVIDATYDGKPWPDVVARLTPRDEED